MVFHFFHVDVAQAPVVISRDHHDVSGTDSPFRETSNVYDGSAFCAGKYNMSFTQSFSSVGSVQFNGKCSTCTIVFIDMAVQNFVGDAFRGATWVALHNGGGVGW